MTVEGGGGSTYLHYACVLRHISEWVSLLFFLEFYTWMMTVSVCVHGVGVPIEMTTDTKFLAYCLLEFVCFYLFFDICLYIYIYKIYDLLLLLLMVMMIVHL